jgi:flagellar export protein FliJ
MKKAEFPLARVKRVRAVEEQLARARFGSAEAMAREAEALVDARQADVAIAIDDLRGLQGAPSLAPSAVITALSVVDHRREELRQALARAQTLRFQAEELRKHWVERAKDLRGLERLESRTLDTARREAEHAEMLQLDETASQRAERASRLQEMAEDGR